MTIVYGCCIGPRDSYEQCYLPSVSAVMRPEDILIGLTRQPSIAVAYNEILTRASSVRSLEAVVLAHDDVCFEEHYNPEIFLDLFRDSSVGLVGVIGGRRPGGMSRWTCTERRGRAKEMLRTHDYPPYSDEVDVIDGFFMAINPLLLDQIRFDERFPAFHGYDADISAKVQAAGYRVRVERLPVIHQTRGSRSSMTSYVAWLQATLYWRATYQSKSPLHRAYLRARKTALPIEARLRPSVRKSVRKRIRAIQSS